MCCPYTLGDCKGFLSTKAQVTALRSLWKAPKTAPRCQSRVRLHAPSAGDDDYVEWQTEVGFLRHWKPTRPILLGQVGFLNRFTVTMNRQCQRVAVEDWNTFDNRFGIAYLS
jgi:hypothetical protein